MHKNTGGSKKKVPEVKMTKTARMRLLNANPHLKYQIEKTNALNITKNLDLNTLSQMKASLLNEFTKKNEQKKVTPEPNITQENSKNLLIKKKPARRSKSAPRLSVNKDVLSTITEDFEMLNISRSVENLPNCNGIEKNSQTSKCIKESENACQLNKRKSPIGPENLGKRLYDWLEKAKKNHSSVKYLQCFGVQKIHIVEDENKENFETTCINRQGSYENLRIDNPLYCKSDTSLAFALSDLQKMAKGAVEDLMQLISEGYPKEQCEAWLKAIRNKCPQIVEDPQYWECRATIEKLKGDIGLALECYKTAVVQGAEVTTIEQSLDELKNVFTSMIIKFAIQEKTLKNSLKTTSENFESKSNTSRLMVTPVRRSTRLSRSFYTSTPGIKMCSSLNELDTEEKQKMLFVPNPAL